MSKQPEKQREFPIRLLRPEEIECRVAMVQAKGVSLLLYKDARVDQRILDETFGIFGWKRSHQCIDGNLYCTVEVFDTEAGVWVSKQDVGTNGLTEKEKSQASDSFKRACFNWGIGRELYSAPFIWIPAGKVNIQSKEGSKYVCYDRFSVASIAYNDNREITELHIVNERGLEVYCWERKPIQEQTKQLPEAGQPAGQKQYQQQEDRSILSVEQLSSLQAELARTGVKMQDVRKRYQVGRPEEMSPELYGKVMRALARTKSAHAA